MFKTLTDAVSNRVNVKKAQHLDQLIPPVINCYRKVEMHNKYCVFFAQVHQDDVLYEAPTEKELQIVKEKKDKKSTVRKNKKRKIMDEKYLIEIEEAAKGEKGCNGRK